MCIPWGRTAPGLYYCFLTVSPLSLHPLPSLFKPALWNSEKVIEAEAYSLQTRNREHRKASVLRRPIGPCSASLLPAAGQLLSQPPVFRSPDVLEEADLGVPTCPGMHVPPPERCLWFPWLHMRGTPSADSSLKNSSYSAFFLFQGFIFILQGGP